MDLHVVRLTDSAVAPLLEGLSTEYASRYGEIIEMANATPEQFDSPTGAFVVLVEDGVTVAGGGLRRVDECTCEVKRMWTAPGHRRRGHATTVLRALEAQAVQLGYRRVVLETGPAQPEAVDLYAARGYARIPAYGPYDVALAYARDVA